ncbi:MAG: TROVE domain-containing protein [Myxococcales bacterium]|nr:TROVE domain-containing protein [Myxococcales bacterium]
MKNLIQHFSTRSTPQGQPIPGSTQVANSAGGFSWAVDDWTRLDRFLILGTEGGSYYATERALTVENASAVARCLAADGPRTVARVAEISRAGRAPRNDPAIFALAMALKLGDLPTRRAARVAVADVCRTGTHVFALAEAVKGLGGWGRITQGAFADWYTAREPSELAYQAVKYQSRNGWSGRDVLRKAHVRPPTPGHDAVFRWMAKGWEGPLDAPVPGLERLWAFEKAKRAETVAEIVALIHDHDLVREAIPTRWLNEPAVWDALLRAGRGMPITALLRNLAKLSAVGLLKPLSDVESVVVRRLADAEVLRKGRVHPLAVLNALSTYRRGRGVKGKLVWTPSTRVVDALDAAYYEAFGAVEPTRKRWLVALDVSGSMAGGSLAGLPALTPRDGAAAMAMVALRTERRAHVISFQDRIVPLDITARDRLDAVVRKTQGLRFGSTDCAQPMLYALKEGLEVDVFAVYTDSETWFGSIHPAQALQQYRRATGIDAKLIVVGMVSNGFTIADPNDAGMLDVVGFDTAAPNVMADFARN